MAKRRRAMPMGMKLACGGLVLLNMACLVWISRKLNAQAAPEVSPGAAGSFLSSLQHTAYSRDGQFAAPLRDASPSARQAAGAPERPHDGMLANALQSPLGAAEEPPTERQPPPVPSGLSARIREYRLARGRERSVPFQVEESWFDLHPQNKTPIEVDLSEFRDAPLMPLPFVPEFAPESGPMGADGYGVTMAKDQLNEQQLDAYNKGWANNGYNQYVSDLIGERRAVREIRHHDCQALRYPVMRLPAASVIICFHNEAWTALIRSINSIIDRSPPNLLKEIIMVDDGSTMEHLGRQLAIRLAKFPKVRLLRSDRVGLIRARLLGASVATAEVLLFLDSHIECTPGWLEPMLEAIYLDRKTVVCPVIDVISDDTIGYVNSAKAITDQQVGGFTWGLVFNWHPLPPEYWQTYGKSETRALRSPTMAGGLFAIDREYFDFLGAYDDGMDIWGGENLEMSFRIWMCGGTLVIHPCSHVGHIFRKKSAYKWREGKNVILANNLRLAEVWMDEFKDYYYESINYQVADYGDVSGRKRVRSELQCKTFRWYLDTIFPTLFVPTDAMARGDIRNMAIDKWCADASAEMKNYNKPAIIYPCHHQGGNQMFMLSKTGEIRREEACLDAQHGREQVITYPCHGGLGNQEWRYEADGAIVHVSTKRCMDMDVAGEKLVVKGCDGSAQQRWQWKRQVSSAKA